MHGFEFVSKQTAYGFRKTLYKQNTNEVSFWPVNERGPNLEH